MFKIGSALIWFVISAMIFGFVFLTDAEQRTKHVIIVGSIGVVLIAVGMFLLEKRNVAIYLCGTALVLTGLCIALYGPGIWLTWNAR